MAKNRLTKIFLTDLIVGPSVVKLLQDINKLR